MELERYIVFITLRGDREPKIAAHRVAKMDGFPPQLLVHRDFGVTVVSVRLDATSENDAIEKAQEQVRNYT